MRRTRRLWIGLWGTLFAATLAVGLLQQFVPTVAAATRGWDIFSLAIFVGLAGAGLLFVPTSG